MKVLSGVSLRTSGVILVLFALLPAFVGIVYSGIALREHLEDDIKQEALFSVNGLAEAQERITVGVRLTLAMLVNTPEIKRMDAKGASVLFATALRLNPALINIVLTDAGGQVLGSGHPYPPVSLADRKSIQDALSGRGFAPGEHVVSRGSEGRVLPFSQAVLDDEGNPVGVVTVAIGLDRYAQLFDLARLPEGSVLYAADHQGVRLLYYPESDQANPVGSALPQDVWGAVSGPDEEGVFQRSGQDGLNRYYVYKRLRMHAQDAPYLYIVVGIPVAAADAAVAAILRKGAALAAGGTVLALGLAWVFTGLTVGRRVEHLLDITGQLGKGLLDARTGLSAAEGELGRLGQGIDEMAQALQNDAARRDKAQEGLRLAAAVFENAVEGIVVTDPQGTIERVNTGFTVITGYTAEEAVGQNPRLLKSNHHDQDFYTALWRQIVQTGRWSGEIWNRRKNGEAYPEWLNITAIRDNSGKLTHYVSVFHDITEIKRQQRTIEFLANHDPLTGLPNRLLFEDRLAVALAQARRKETKLGLLFLDLDNFKNVNDSLGHDVGDLLLREASERLGKAIREGDTVCRLGGDEFIIILPEVRGPEDVLPAAGRVLDSLGKPFRLQGYDVVCTASIGATLSPDDGTEAGELLKKADLAMYRAKRAGGNAVQFFAAGMDVLVSHRLFLEGELRKALERDEFELYYQPVTLLKTGHIVGAEALLRWRRGGELVGPDDFIPLAEETGLIVEIGAWVLAAALRQAREWGQEGLPRVSISVNISAKQFRQHNFEEVVQNMLQLYAMEPGRVYLEVTESALITNLASSADKLARLRAKGIRVLLDDFGTGYSSLSYLKRLPVDGLKIDRSFVGELPQDADGQNIVAAILAMSRALGLLVVAEGVESRGQLQFLDEQGCGFIQGFLAGKPMPAGQFKELLLAAKPLYEPLVVKGDSA